MLLLPTVRSRRNIACDEAFEGALVFASKSASFDWSAASLLFRSFGDEDAVTTGGVLVVTTGVLVGAGVTGGGVLGLPEDAGGTTMTPPPPGVGFELQLLAVGDAVKVTAPVAVSTTFVTLLESHVDAEVPAPEVPTDIPPLPVLDEKRMNVPAVPVDMVITAFVVFTTTVSARELVATVHVTPEPERLR